jgi:hypothetical protein
MEMQFAGALELGLDSLKVMLWLCDGIWLVVRVVSPIDRLPLTEGVPNAVLNAVEPPELAVPETTRIALSLWVVLLVHPVGAAVCTNNITVPDGTSDGSPF